MSYTRDPDALSRGVGAIAAIDHALPAAQHRRAQINRALQRRERIMSAISMGALGGMYSPPGDKRPSSDKRTPSSDKRTTPPPSDSTNTGGVYVKSRGKNTGPAPTPTKDRPGTVQTRDRSGATPPAAPVPTAPTAPAVPTAPVPVVAGGGTVGAGGSSLPTTPGYAPPGAMYDPIPQVPTTDLTGGSSDDGTMKMLMIAGGAALIAYLLFRSKETP